MGVLYDIVHSLKKRCSERDCHLHEDSYSDICKICESKLLEKKSHDTEVIHDW